MDLRNYRYFMKIAELENISKAAKELHIAQPALSRVVKNMEQELGRDLFERTGKSIRMNANGEIVYQHMKQVFETLDHMEAELYKQEQMESSVLYLAFNSASCLIPRLTLDFKKMCPNVEIRLSSSVNTETCMFYIDSFYEERTSKEYIPLMKEEVVLAYAPTHRIASLDEITWEELAKETFLYSKGCHSIYSMAQVLCKERGGSAPRMIECVSSQTVLNFLESGIGIALIPKITWNLYNHPGLVYCELPDGPHSRTIYLQKIQPNKSFFVAKNLELFCVEYFKRIEKIAAQNDTLHESILTLI